MKKLLILSFALVGCTHAAPVEPLEKTSPFDGYEAALEMANEASKQCTIGHPTGRKNMGCDLDADPFGLKACKKFDDMMQPVLEPLKTCASAELMSADPSLEAQCDRYIGSLMSSCAGVHSIFLAYSDRQASQSYRDAIENGDDKEAVKKLYENRIVRYRD